MGYDEGVSKSLIDAIRRGDLSLVGELLDQGADVDYRLPAEEDYGAFLHEVTPLMVAVSAPKSTPEIVRLLLSKGADPFAVSAGGVTATWYACGGGTGYAAEKAIRDELEPNHPYHLWGGGSAECLQLMLDAGGDPNESADNGRSCVYEACSVADPLRLKLLIERGAKVDPTRFRSRSRYRLIPLFAASESGSLDCVRLIVEAGFPADYEHREDNALKSAGSLEVVEYLWEKGVRPTAGSFGFDAMDEAIEENNLPVLRFLLGKADRATIQQKLLTASGVRMNPDAIPLIIEAGADANLPDESYGSPLHSACWQGDGNGGRPTDVTEKTVQLLLDYGADPNLLSRGTRPLHEAVDGDWASPTSVRVLLSRGAEVDGTSKDGETALILAAIRLEIECVQLLLEAGADRSIKDKRGRTALDYAASYLEEREKPRAKVLDVKGAVGKAFNWAGIDMAEIDREQLVQARQVVELLKA